MWGVLVGRNSQDNPPGPHTVAKSDDADALRLVQDVVDLAVEAQRVSQLLGQPGAEALHPFAHPQGFVAALEAQQALKATRAFEAVEYVQHRKVPWARWCTRCE